MRKIRVLVVDDSTLIRRLMTEALQGDPELEVVATASNGKIALAKLTQVAPDVVTLDVEMPELNGLETLVELRKTHPLLPVIMFSTLTDRGAEATLNALANGANDYVNKPSNVGSLDAALHKVRMELIPKIKGLCKWYCTDQCKDEDVRLPLLATRKRPFATHSAVPQTPSIIAIGVSTGGPNALAAVLSELPANLSVPIVIVQHMPPIFTKHLADRLNQTCALDVVEGRQGQPLKPGVAYIAPGDFHMRLRSSGQQVSLEMNQEPQENSCRPAVDVLFRSVAETYGRRALCFVLTGMGRDGMRGCEAIRARGGRVIAQDEASSVVWGMPGAVVKAGYADEVLPLHQVSQKIAASCLTKTPTQEKVLLP